MQAQGEPQETLKLSVSWVDPADLWPHCAIRKIDPPAQCIGCFTGTHRAVLGLYPAPGTLYGKSHEWLVGSWRKKLPRHGTRTPHTQPGDPREGGGKSTVGIVPATSSTPLKALADGTFCPGALQGLS